MRGATVEGDVVAIHAGSGSGRGAGVGDQQDRDWRPTDDLSRSAGQLRDDPLTDEQLAALALAADPEAALDPDAVCLWDLIDGPGGGVGLLPGWYMPAPTAGTAGRRRWWRRPVAVLLIASFLVIDALGLCITYGQLVVA